MVEPKKAQVDIEVAEAEKAGAAAGAVKAECEEMLVRRRNFNRV